jgi:hypothetical protein
MVRYTHKIPKDPSHLVIKNGKPAADVLSNDKTQVMASTVPRFGTIDLEHAY